MPRLRKPPSPFRYFNSSPEVIRLVVMMYVRFPLSLRNVEDLLFERGIDICHETVRTGGTGSVPCLQPTSAGSVSPETITTDGLRSYKAAMTELGGDEKQEIGRWAHNRWRTATCRSDDESGQCRGSGE